MKIPEIKSGVYQYRTRIVNVKLIATEPLRTQSFFLCDSVTPWQEILVGLKSSLCSREHFFVIGLHTQLRHVRHVG